MHTVFFLIKKHLVLALRRHLESCNVRDVEIGITSVIECKANAGTERRLNVAVNPTDGHFGTHITQSRF